MIEKIDNKLETVEKAPNQVENFWDILEKNVNMDNTRSSISDCRSFWNKLEKDDKIERLHLPETDGHWEGERGNSDWIPDAESVPKDRRGTNLEGKSWGEILAENDIEAIPFKDGEPDFSEIAKEEVEIGDFTDDRSSNFSQADEALAKKWGCEPEDVAQWRKEHKYTWHEKSDCKTLQLVPREVHGNVPHSGGVSKYKSQHM